MHFRRTSIIVSFGYLIEAFDRIVKKKMDIFNQVDSCFFKWFHFGSVGSCKSSLLKISYRLSDKNPKLMENGKE